MRKGLLVCTGAVASVLLAVGPAIASPAPKATGGAGYFNDAGDNAHVEFNASGTPADGTGVINYQNLTTGVHFVADVNCFNWQPNRPAKAQLSGVIRTGDFVGSHVRVIAEDLGEPGATGQQFTSDKVRTTLTNVDCTVQRSAMHLITNGNVQVKGSTRSSDLAPLVVDSYDGQDL